MTVILHDDGTVCRHRGRPAWPAGDPYPACPAGQLVTRARLSGQDVDLADAVNAARSAAAAFTAALTPLVTQLARLAARLAEDPRLRVLDAAAAAYDAELAAGTPADPCGNGPLETPGQQLLPGMPVSRRPLRLTWRHARPAPRPRRAQRARDRPRPPPRGHAHPPARAAPQKRSQAPVTARPPRDPADPLWTLDDAAGYFTDIGMPFPAARLARVIAQLPGLRPAAETASGPAGGRGKALYRAADLMRLHSALLPWLQPRADPRIPALYPPGKGPAGTPG